MSSFPDLALRAAPVGDTIKFSKRIEAGPGLGHLQAWATTEPKRYSTAAKSHTSPQTANLFRLAGGAASGARFGVLQGRGEFQQRDLVARPAQHLEAMLVENEGLSDLRNRLGFVDDQAGQGHRFLVG
jgi:hypothetical protein